MAFKIRNITALKELQLVKGINIEIPRKNGELAANKFIGNFLKLYRSAIRFKAEMSVIEADYGAVHVDMKASKYACLLGRRQLFHAGIEYRMGSQDPRSVFSAAEIYGSAEAGVLITAFFGKLLKQICISASPHAAVKLLKSDDISFNASKLLRNSVKALTAIGILYVISCSS